DPILTPTRYEDYLADARQQYSTEEIAGLFHVHPDTLYNWLNKYPAMHEAQERGRERRRLAFVKEAKRGLFKQLCGYDVEETRTVIVDGNIKEQHITRRHIPANVAAAIFVLCNMQPEEWTRSNTRTLDFEDNNRRAFTVKVIDNTADKVAGAIERTRKNKESAGDGTTEITP
ncbi:MAG: helix-turn-helix domain-containing protein, partial [Clostridiales bacterium]|nr:helix-turn-helix domain-containing protein [Clostridiales bacterium]